MSDFLTESQKQELDNVSEMYFDALNEFKSAEAKKEAFNCMLKETMSDCGISKYSSTSGLSVSIRTRPNVKWDEEGLLKFIKTLNIDGVVKTKEYVDMDALENALYHGTITAEQLKKFQDVKPDTVYLTIKQKEKLNE